jgi:hypothetical protein
MEAICFDTSGISRATRPYNPEVHTLQEYYFLADVQERRLLFIMFLVLFDQPPLNPTTADVSLLPGINRYCSVYYNMRSKNGCHNIPARFSSYIIFISSFIIWKCILWCLYFHSNITSSHSMISFDFLHLLNVSRKSRLNLGFMSSFHSSYSQGAQTPQKAGAFALFWCRN